MTSSDSPFVDSVGKLTAPAHADDFYDDLWRRIEREPQRPKHGLLAAFSRLTSSRRLRFATLLIAAVAGAFALTTLSSAGVDESAINSTIASFQQAEADQAGVPADYVSTIESRLDALVPAADGRAHDDGSPVQLLPSELRKKIDQAWAVRLATYCSEAYQKRHAGDESLSSVIEAGLYNNPQLPLVVREETKVLASSVARDDGDSAIVWTYSWWGDVTTKGNGGQSWSIVEYRMIKEGGQWKVDGRSTLVTAESDAKEGTWGPYSPHTSLASAEQEGPSAIYPDQAILREQLQALVDMAASGR